MIILISFELREIHFLLYLNKGIFFLFVFQVVLIIYLPCHIWQTVA